MSEPIKELLKFVQVGARLDLKAIAVEHVLGNKNKTYRDSFINLQTL